MSVTLFKALADETRIRLLHLLLQHELSVNELVSVLEMGQSRISRHLRILTEAGLLISRRDGLWVFYQAQKKGEGAEFIGAVSRYLEAVPGALEDSARANRLLAEKNAKTQEFFNSIAENWDSLSRELLGEFDLPKAVCEAIPQSCQVAVDLGCGTGAVLAHMLEKAPNVIGVDGASGMLDICRRRFAENAATIDKVSLRIGELAHLPLKNQEADFASINLVLHHLEKPALALAEARRILSPKGRLFVTEFLHHYDESMRSRYGDRWLGFEEEWLTTALREAGFTRTRIRKQKIGRNLTLLLVTSSVDAWAGA